MTAYEMRPAAVVLVVRDGLVLALTRRDVLWSLCFPGGKSEEVDRGDMRETAARELREEIGLRHRIHVNELSPICELTSGSSRRVHAFMLSREATATLPDTFARTNEGQPMWAPPQLLVAECQPFHRECYTVLTKARVIVSGSRGRRDRIDEEVATWRRLNPDSDVNLAYRIERICDYEYLRGRDEFADGLAAKLRSL